MNARSPAAVVATVTLVGVLFTAAVQLQAARERAYPPGAETEASLYLRSGVGLRRVTGAYNTLFADLYWLRAIQYYGGIKQRLDHLGALPPIEPPPALAADAFPLLYPLLDITTTLDPRFSIAYRFGSIFLAEPYPRGANRPDLAITLLEKGLKERPDKWQYLEDIGFVHYWFLHDFKTASEWFGKAADVPGAPWWLLAGGDDAGAGRRSAVVARDVGGDSAVGGAGLAAPGSGAPPAPAAGARRDRRVAATRRRRHAPRRQRG